MAKFVVEVLDRYEIVAESFADAERIVRDELRDGGIPDGEYLDGYVSIEEEK